MKKAKEQANIQFKAGVTIAILIGFNLKNYQSKKLVWRHLQLYT